MDRGYSTRAWYTEVAKPKTHPIVSAIESTARIGTRSERKATARMTKTMVNTMPTRRGSVE